MASSDEECSGLFESWEPEINNNSTPQKPFIGFSKLNDAALRDLEADLPTEVWMLIFNELTTAPEHHQVWWRILSEVSKHINYALKVYFQRIHHDRFVAAALITDYLAEQGALSCLQYAHEHGCTWSSQTTAKAAKGGSLACLKYLHERGCDWDEVTCFNSASEGHFECLRYAHENGCAWTSITTAVSTQRDDLASLKYEHENGCDWDLDALMVIAASNGSIECLKYIHEKGANWALSFCHRAATYGHIDCIQYALDNGCPINNNCLCASAVQNKDISCLKYLHEKGYPWGQALINAACYGSLNALKYIHENGETWSPSGEETKEAFLRGNIDVLRYVVETGCPLDPLICDTRRTFRKVTKECRDYVHALQPCNSVYCRDEQMTDEQ